MTARCEPANRTSASRAQLLETRRGTRRPTHGGRHAQASRFRRPPVLSTSRLSGGSPTLQRPASSAAGASSTATSSCPKSSAATTCARAARRAGFKACCMRSGRHDGANRDDYFQGVTAVLLRHGRTPGSGLRACLFRPSRSCFRRFKDVDARVKPAHDEGEVCPPTLRAMVRDAQLRRTPHHEVYHGPPSWCGAISVR